MCQAKPGPRCSDHAGKKLAATKARRDETHAAWVVADAARGGKRLVESSPEYREWAAVSNAAVAARDDHFDALTEWRTTPAGQAELEQDIAAAEAGGDTTTVGQMKGLLLHGRETREQQVRDLQSKEAQEARVGAATPEEVAFLSSFDTRIADAQQELDGIRGANAAADLEARPAREALRAADAANLAEVAAARLRVDAATTDLHNSLRVYRQEANRLYADAGARNGRFYVEDMAQSTLGTSTYNHERSPGQVLPVCGIKTKRQGPDVEACKAAKAAASTDAAFLAAKEDVKSKHAALAANEQAQQAVGYALGQTSTRRMKDTQSQWQADGVVAAAQTRLDTLNAAKTDARLRVGAGIGSAPATNLGWHALSDTLQQNPDGTLNVWSREAPSDGFPHGRYLRATGVTGINGGMHGLSNSLVMENGTRRHTSEHVFRSAPGHLSSPRSTPVLVAVQAQPGAVHPTLPAKAWGYYVDSTD